MKSSEPQKLYFGKLTENFPVKSLGGKVLPMKKEKTGEDWGNKVW